MGRRKSRILTRGIVVSQGLRDTHTGREDTCRADPSRQGVFKSAGRLCTQLRQGTGPGMSCEEAI